MLDINWFAIGAFLTFTTCFSVFIIFFLYGYEKIHRLWAVFNLNVALWAGLDTTAALISNPELSLKFWLFSMVAAVFIGITFSHFISQFCNIKNPFSLCCGYFYSLGFSALTLINDGNILYNGTKNIYGMHFLSLKPLAFFLAWAPWGYWTLWANLTLYRYYKNISVENKHEALMIFVSTALSFFGGTLTLAPMFLNNFYPTTIFLVAIYGAFQSYAIFRHKILQLDIFIKTGFIYSLLISATTVLYIFLIFLVENLFRHQIGYASPASSLLIILLLAVVVTPLKNRIQTIADKFFLKGSPIEIADENEYLRKGVAETEKFKAVATLASGIAHEIKNPLTVINTFLEYYPQKKNDPEFEVKFTQIAAKEIHRIDNLVKQLLDFAKPSPLQLQLTDINSLLENTLTRLSNKLHKNIKIIKNLAALPKIYADSNKLEPAFLNIMLNAIEAMPVNGELTIHTQIVKSNDLEINIQDNGPGIDPKDLPHIFDPFYTKKEKGTGLGLAITKGIIEEHGGRIKVTSSIGHGTRY